MPNKEGLWCPDNCPITGLAFFMWLSHPDLGYVPTYGGPLDSYTLATVDEDGDIRSERYDHDEGDWVEGGEPMRASRKLTDAIDNYTPPAPDARNIPGLFSMSARAGNVTLRFDSETSAQRFMRTYHTTVAPKRDGSAPALPGAVVDKDAYFGKTLRYYPESAERKQSIARAVAANGGIWPAQLESGVMFYEGERITRADFNAAVRASKEGS